MHLTYESVPDKTELMQGDVLARVPEIEAILEEVHPHFFKDSNKNPYFMVLSQTCDLVKHQGACKTRYVTLAPVRSLDLVIDRHLHDANAIAVRAELPVLDLKAKNKTTEFLQRLFNNNEPGYFYLDAADTELAQDSVAFLSLSIAIRSDLHFGACLKAKILQLDSTFQAKLGWLVGQIYSRVGTDDWPTPALKAKIKQVIAEAAIWVDGTKVTALEKEFQRLVQGVPEAQMTRDQIDAVLAKVPTKKQVVFGEVSRIVKAALGPGQDALADRISKRLENDEGLALHLK